MSELPSSPLWEVSPETVHAVRALHSLDESRAREAVSMLRDWVHKQPHFRKKDFNDHYLENIIIAAKGSVERAKEKIDKYCTIRSMMPKSFEKIDANQDFEGLNSMYYLAFSSRLTDSRTRLFIFKVSELPYTSESIVGFYKYIVLIMEYLREYDCNDGVEIVIDYTLTNLRNLIPKLNPIDLGYALTVATEGYSMRIKSIHVISESTLVDTVVGLFKQVLSKKLSERIHVHKNYDGLKDYLPEEIMPTNYGGPNKSIEESSADLQKELGSPRVIQHLKSMQAATSDESCRPIDQFNEQYMGMPGTFRTLTVD